MMFEVFFFLTNWILFQGFLFHVLFGCQQSNSRLPFLLNKHIWRQRCYNTVFPTSKSVRNLIKNVIVKMSVTVTTTFVITNFIGIISRSIVVFVLFFPPFSSCRIPADLYLAIDLQDGRRLPFESGRNVFGAAECGFVLGDSGVVIVARRDVWPLLYSRVKRLPQTLWAALCLLEGYNEALKVTEMRVNTGIVFVH